MKDHKAFLEQYSQLVHISQGENGENVNWFGHFAGLHEQLAEGFAYEAVLDGGKPVVRPVRNGYAVRLCTRKLIYTPINHFFWMRPRDGKDFLRPTDEMVRIPCIAAQAVKTEHFYDDPYFKTIQRRIAILRAVPSGSGAGMQLRFVEEVS